MLLRNAIRPAVGRTIGRLQSASHPANISLTRHLLSTLAILEQREGQLNQGSLGAITAAKKLGGSVHAFIAGNNASSSAQEASKTDGLEKVVAVNSAAYERVRAKPPRPFMLILYEYTYGRLFRSPH